MVGWFSNGIRIKKFVTPAFEPGPIPPTLPVPRIPDQVREDETLRLTLLPQIMGLEIKHIHGVGQLGRLVT